VSARVDVLGVGFDRVDLAGAAERILRRLDAGDRTFVITANPEFVMLTRQDADVAQIARDADLVVADGSGVVAASRLLRDPLPRVPGRLLVDALVPHLAQRRSRVFFLGAAPGVGERAAAEVRRRAPGFVVAGVHAAVWRISAVGVFLALSVPAVAWVQESAVLLLVGTLLLILVGAAFWWMWRRETRL